jgi:hypothetical protein
MKSEMWRGEDGKRCWCRGICKDFDMKMSSGCILRSAYEFLIWKKVVCTRLDMCMWCEKTKCALLYVFIRVIFLLLLFFFNFFISLVSGTRDYDWFTVFLPCPSRPNMTREGVYMCVCIQVFRVIYDRVCGCMCMEKDLQGKEKGKALCVQRFWHESESCVHVCVCMQ